VLLDVPGAGLGERRQLAAAVVGEDDEALVGEQAQRRVDGAGARPPRPLGALGQLGDDLVAVHGLLVEQHEDRRADLAAGGAAAATGASRAEPVAEARAAQVAAGAEGPEARPGAAAAAAPDGVRLLALGRGAAGVLHVAAGRDVVGHAAGHGPARAGARPEALVEDPPGASPEAAGGTRVEAALRTLLAAAAPAAALGGLGRA
jgi:hypothetical protein